MKALTASEMREVDRLTTERFGIPSSQLMESAGRHVADAVLRRFPPSGNPNVTILCGKGNNGGDGLTAARHLRDGGINAIVYLLGDPQDLRGDARLNYDRYVRSDAKVSTILDQAGLQLAFYSLTSADVIVDGLLGTGLRGAASGLVASAIEDVNRLSQNMRSARPALILAIDTPSGLSSDGEPVIGPVLHAHETVTFTTPKVGQLVSVNAASVGRLTVVDIGSPRSLVEEIGRSPIRWVEAQEFSSFSFGRWPDSNKGLFGHILLVAGSVGKTGAAVMGAHAALRTGAGLVTVATPEPAVPAVAAAHPEYMTEPLLPTDEGTIAAANLDSGLFAAAAKGKTLFAIGPGLGQYPETQSFIRAAVHDADIPIVLDADGLNAFVGRAHELRQRKSAFLAITPHPGEMARLMGCTVKDVQHDRVKSAIESAKRWNAHVVLKGYHTVIASPDGGLFVSTPGNPGMAKGGSGDVLTGVLAGITGQFGTADWVRVLALGVELHGRAADIAIEGTDASGLLASEISDAVPLARYGLVQEIRGHA